LILAAIALFLVTSAFGRVWCGYTCPQTVWVDLFLMVERFFEGDRNARLRLDKAKWSWSKLARKTAKHVTWLTIAVLTGGAWVLYMNDAPTLIKQLVELEAPLTTYFWIMVLTGTTYILGGIAREQVCTYMCPWPRIQGVMMDEDTLAVMYKYDRGEPRGSHKENDSWDNRGDCIDCHQCIVVCPMGIDIRDGFQLECIQCSLCIDACDEVMTKIGRPKGLIGYDSMTNFARREKGLSQKRHIVRPRTLLYAILVILISGAILYGLTHRSTLELNILRDRNPLFVQLSSGDIRNGYTIKILNKTHQSQRYSLSISGLPHYRIKIEGVKDRTAAGLPIITVNKDGLRAVKIYITIPKAELGSNSMAIAITVKNLKGTASDRNVTTFKGPET